MNATQPAAIVIDQWEILRLGVEKVLSDLDFLVVGSTGRAEDGMLLARSSVTEFIIVGIAPDLKRNRLLSFMEREKAAGRRMDLLFMVDRATPDEIEELMANGASGVILRSSGAAEMARAITTVRSSGRFLGSQMTPGALGRIGAPHEAPVDSPLSPKELEVLVELASGATYDQIALHLVVTKATVKTHLVHIYQKLEVANRNQAVTKALALGLLT